MLSLTLSNTTIVSYSEKPRMVRKATTVAGVTSNRNTEYTPTLINTSCIMAMIAASAMRHSSRQAMNSDTRIKKMMRARTAFSVMLRPHVEPTALTLTDTASTLAAVASASLICWRLATDWSPTWTRIWVPDADESCWILALVLSTPLASSTDLAWPTVRCAGRNLPAHTAFEVEPQVETAGEHRHDGDDEQHGRPAEAPPAATVEVDRRLAVVQPPAATPTDPRRGQDVGAHAAPPVAATSMPMTLRRAIHSVRASSSTAGRVKK